MTRAIELSQLGSSLDVGTEIELSSPLRTNNAIYSSNINVPYLIAGTSGYTGATTNWNTFGLQHRIKSDSGGVPRVTIDHSGGELFCVEVGGRVGIGTASPQYELDVSKTKDGASVVARVGNNSDTGNLSAILQLRVGTNTVKYVNLNTNYTASYFHLSGVNITTAYYSFNTHIFRDNAATERLRITSSGDAQLKTANARLEWQAASGGTNPFIRSIGTDQEALEFNTNGDERVRIGSGGNVGIGTDNPQVKLDVDGTLQLRASGSTTYATRIYSRLDSTHCSVIESYLNNSTAFEMMGTYADGGGANPRVVISAGGQPVGIGTNAPDAKLDVNGTVAINRPANYWQNNTQIFFNDSTNPIGSIGHHGGFALALTSNGYRNSSGQWTSHGVNSFTGAAQIEVQPQGNIYFRTDSNKATGTSTNPTNRIHIDSLGRMRIGGITPLYALDVRGESMSGLEYKAISSENGVLARECAGFGHANDNSSGCGVECILFGNLIQSNWLAFDLFIRASSCATTGASHSSAWFFYRCRVYANSGFSFTQVDSGGDTGSISISINDDGNVGTAIGLGSDTDARQFEVRMSRSGGQRSTLSVFANSYPKISRFRRQP